MKRYLRFCLVLVGVLFFWNVSNAQVYRAFLGIEGQTQVSKLSDYLEQAVHTKAVDPLPGWPKRIAANATFKNMRGVALADIDGDGNEEIAVASNNKLYVYKADGSILWIKPLLGTAIYPPTVGDVNLDGNLEIAQATGGSPASGRIYLVDQNGNDLPGWPQNFSNNWILCSPVMADVDGNDTLEIIFNERVSPQGKLHVCKVNGSPLNANWPVVINATPSVTPSVGDIDGDLSNEIILCSYNDILAFDINGALKPGFPVLNPNTTFSYQSPLLLNLDQNNTLNIVGSTIGDVPEYYALNYDGTYRSGWPVAVPDNSWTYCPPAAADIDQNGTFSIFMTKPINDTVLPMLYGFDESGAFLPDFPVSAQGGDEGIVTIADVDGDGVVEILTGSNLCVAGYGFIHAFKLDGSGEASGFPLRPAGFSYMNGANLGDLNNDGLMELVSLSYDQTFSPSDSVTINVYALGVPCNASSLLFGTYKGKNTRDGLITTNFSAISQTTSHSNQQMVYPNPSNGSFSVQLDPEYAGDISISLYNTSGILIYQQSSTCTLGCEPITIDPGETAPGMYLLKIDYADNVVMKKMILD